MEAVKIILFVALACFTQGQAAPAQQVPLKPILYINVTAAVYTGSEEKQVIEVKLDATISGQPKSKSVDIRPVIDMINSKVAFLQAQGSSEELNALGLVKNNNLTLILSEVVEAEFTINLPNKQPKVYGLDLDYNVWALRNSTTLL